VANYDSNNVFARIMRGELPCYKVYEDDRAFALLDIMPRAPGHTLVLPKSPARGLLDVGADDLAHVMIVAQKIAKAAMTAFDADGITLMQFNEAAGGQAIYHLHVHVIPRKERVDLRAPETFQESQAVLTEHAAKLVMALKAV
jgi:histidine triad (HIT) family protein